MFLRTCDCCGEIISSDKPFFRIRFEKFYDDARCEDAITHGLTNYWIKPEIDSDFCNGCTIQIRDCIRNMQRKNMGNKAKELNI